MTSGFQRGDLRQYLQLEVRVLSPDSAGGFDEVWQAAPANPGIYARISAMAAGIDSEGRRAVPVAQYRIITPYRSDIAAGMRLRADDRVYDIVSALDVTGRREYLEIRAIMQG